MTTAEIIARLIEMIREHDVTVEESYADPKPISALPEYDVIRMTPTTTCTFT